MILPSLFAWFLASYMVVGSLARLQFVPDAMPTNNPPEEAQTLLDLENNEEEDRMEFSLHDWDSPVYPLIYGVPLPIPPVKEPLMQIVNPVTGQDIWYFEIEIQPFTRQIYPNLCPANLIGYDGMFPGPTFIIPKNTETIVRFINNAVVENAVHLHGSYSRAPFDGWAEDITLPGEYKDYYYPNSQTARMMWYHDHAMSITAENANLGQAGAWIIADPAEDALGLPSGYGEFDIPLILTSKHYNENGTLLSTVGEDKSYWGDVIEVNGQPWPFLNVEPRKYRFRFLNSAVSRSFALYFIRCDAPNARIPFQVIASDAGLLTHPVQVADMFIAVAERYEIVFDFTPFAGESLEIRNFDRVGGRGVEDDFAETDKVIRFNVSPDPPVTPDTSVVPNALSDVRFPPRTHDIDHIFHFGRRQSEWRINGIAFADVQNRILANVPRGTVEIWELENDYSGWSHPIHIHLVDFRVIWRDGSRGVLPYEEAGLKDVVWLGRGETVRVEAHYAPWDGLYMFHCHNLIHEDQDMMAAFNVTSLADFGYNETSFMDPMEERWRAVPYELADLRGRTGPFTNEAITEKVQFMASFDPYSRAEEILEALKEYHNLTESLSSRDLGNDLQNLHPSVRSRRLGS